MLATSVSKRATAGCTGTGGDYGRHFALGGCHTHYSPHRAGRRKPPALLPASSRPVSREVTFRDSRKMTCRERMRGVPGSATNVDSHSRNAAEAFPAEVLVSPGIVQTYLVIL